MTGLSGCVRGVNPCYNAVRLSPDDYTDDDDDDHDDSVGGWMPVAVNGGGATKIGHWK